MFEKLAKMIDIFFNDWQYLVTVAVIMVSALIVLLGSLKPFVFDKIKNKDLRGTALFFSSIVLSFATTAVVFWIKDWNFVYYVYASAGFSVWTIFVYSLYEYTRLRKLIDWIGSIALEKFFGVLKNNPKKVKDELNVALNDLAKATKKVVKHDKELDNV